MIRSKLLRIASATTAAVVLTTPSHAAFRAYIASTGADNPSCSLASPCRLLPAAITAVDAGGEIWMLDSANYNSGQVNITKSVSILAVPGAVGSVLATGGTNAISIATPSIKVSLRNLVIVMSGSAANGISYTDGTELIISECEVANISGMGAAVYAWALGGKLTIKDSTLRNSNYNLYVAFVTATLDRVRILNSSNIGLYAYNGSRLTINDSLISGNNTGAFIYSGGSGVGYAAINRSVISGNAQGLYVQSVVTGDITDVVLSNSTVTLNTGNGITVYQGASSVSKLTLDGNNVTLNGAGLAVSAGTPAILTRSNNTFTYNSSGNDISGIVTGLAAQ